MPYRLGWIEVFLPKWIVILSVDLAHLLPDLTTSEGEYLGSETDCGMVYHYKAERTCFSMIYNTSYIQITPEIYGFIKYSKLFVLTLYCWTPYRVFYYYQLIPIVHEHFFPVFSAGDWGGALGLFFGASLLSFIETIDFFLPSFSKPSTKKSVQKTTM